ncbi:MAG: CocE/NonD family hydrolase [Pseudomonadota bacterium]
MDHSSRHFVATERIIDLAAFRPRSAVRHCALLAILCALLLPSLASEQLVFVEASLNEHIVMVPAGRDQRALLETTVFQPDGAGPFPLLIINHGKEAGLPRQQPRERFIFMATAFVKRGYAVMVPMRQGFADSGGSYIDYGCDMTAHGHAQAADVRDVIEFARAQPSIDSDRIVVAGQSYGGLATLALGTTDIDGVRGLINFAGGLRDNGGSCNWRAALVKAFGQYGAASKLDSLWIYGANDSLFAPPLVTRLHKAFTGAGGNATLVRAGPFKRDAHLLLASRDGEQVWLPELIRFLERIGMPTREIYTVIPAPRLAKTDYAALDDVDAVPFLGGSGRDGYRDYLARTTPRAFAIAPSGAWSWAEDGEEPERRALDACKRKAGQTCRLYSIDEDVVWPQERSLAAHAGAAGTLAAERRGSAM